MSNIDSINEPSTSTNIVGSNYTHWLLGHKLWVAGFTVLLLIICGFGASKLGLTTDNRVFFGPDNPQLKNFELFEKTFTENNNVVVAFAPKSKNIFENATLEAIEEFTEKAWKLPFSTRVDSLSNFQHSYAINDELIIQDLYKDANSLSADKLATIRNIALKEPLILNRLVSSDGSVGTANINFILPNRTDEKSNREVITALRTLKNEIENQFPDVKLYLTGDIVLGAAVGEATEDDVSTLIPAMLVLILIVIGLTQKSTTALVATLSVIIATIVTTMGLAGWLGYILNPGSAIAPTIVITICAAYCVHIINSVSNSKNDKMGSISSAIQENIFAVFLTCITTIIGFLSMMFSDSPPFHDLGIIVSIGVATTFIYVFTLLPVLLYVLPKKSGKSNSKSFSQNPIINSIVALAKKKNGLVLTGLLTVFAISIFGATKLRLIDDWVEYFDQRYTFRTDSDFIIEHMSGIESLEFSINSGTENGISTSEFLSTIDNFTNWLRSQPGVDYVYSLSDIIKRINKNMHNDEQEYYKIPANTELASQYLLLYQMSLPYGLGLDNYLNFDKSKIRVSVVGDLDTEELRHLEQRSMSWLRDNSPKNVSANATGMSLIFAHISARNIETMLNATMLALILVSIILVMALKSVKLGLISLIPNLFPAAIAVGLWGWFYGELGMAIAVVGAMTLGIIVDDTIHFLSRFQAAMKNGVTDPIKATRYAFDSVGGALFTTTCALVAGFGILAFSGFQVNWGMGLLAAITIAVALVTDFLLLPMILALAYKKREDSDCVETRSPQPSQVTP